MDKDYWVKRWENKELAFHQAAANHLLVKYFQSLPLQQGSRVLVPLCGKTLDIGWLLSCGYSVVGIELAKSAVEELFVELELVPIVEKMGDVLHYKSDNIDIYVGDIFDVTRELVGDVNAVYDRAALIALPETMHQNYADHLIKISKCAPQFLITIEYDETKLDGPPFSTRPDAVNKYYQGHFEIEKVTTETVADGLRGVEATERVWVLQPK